ncbi:MAG: hypothetical protein OXF26_08290, partial [Alphaproteobacteria bacterium]|nr:hypothetical protein [Alphaproteobacteria bacterium]
MVADVDRLLAKSSPELGEVGYRDMVQRPEEIFVERTGTLEKPDLDAVGQQILLSSKVPFLDPFEQLPIFRFQDEHAIPSLAVR